MVISIVEHVKGCDASYAYLSTCTQKTRATIGAGIVHDAAEGHVPGCGLNNLYPTIVDASEHFSRKAFHPRRLIVHSHCPCCMAHGLESCKPFSGSPSFPRLQRGDP